jgi:beta-aspartyl-peptidase (threonine type)
MSVLRTAFAFWLVASLATSICARGEGPEVGKRVVLAVHGGAGVRDREKMTPELRRKYEEALTRALRAGFDALKTPGGTSLDAVEAAVKVMEDSPLFNAGKGAVFNHEGRIEHDASIMDGRTKKAGAVAGVSRLKNPVVAARAVMEQSERVFLIGPGAEQFALKAGVEEANPVDFWTEERWKQLLDELEHEKRAASGRAAAPAPSGNHFGTVGAVALDRNGDLAAATSTGGLSNKRYGRVGDSPVIGAGTYAENGVCAVSCTGHGEVFIRFAVAHDVVARLKYGQSTDVSSAARAALDSLPREDGGSGGLIALDSKGRAAMPFNTSGMYRGTITESGEVRVAIFEGE